MKWLLLRYQPEKVNGIKVGMTAKGHCTDIIYIERFWRSFKREEFYLNEYENVSELKKAINIYIEFYNHINDGINC